MGSAQYPSNVFFCSLEKRCCGLTELEKSPSEVSWKDKEGLSLCVVSLGTFSRTVRSTLMSLSLLKREPPRAGHTGCFILWQADVKVDSMGGWNSNAPSTDFPGIGM